MPLVTGGSTDEDGGRQLLVMAFEDDEGRFSIVIACETTTHIDRENRRNKIPRQV